MTFEKRIPDLDPNPGIEDIDLFETSKGGSGSYFISYSDIKLDLQDTLYTAGTGIDITLGVISAIPMPSIETLQIVYDNGLPGIKGLINLAPDESFRLVSTDAAFVPPSMTVTQFSAIVTKFDGMIAFAHDVERHIVYNAATENLIAYISDIDQSKYGEMYFNDNITPTNITLAANPVKVTGTYIPGFLNLFTHSSGALTYSGNPRNFKVTADLSCTIDLFPGDVSVFIYKNGLQILKSKKSVYIGATTPANHTISCSCMIDLVSGDYIEVYIQNDLATDDIIVTQFNCILTSMLSL
jgi:hypothetical protein